LIERLQVTEHILRKD